jgi:O-antigen ligase
MTKFVNRLTQNCIGWTPVAILACAIGLVAVSPFGAESTHPVFFLIYRTGLIGLILLSLLALSGTSAPDFPRHVYLLGGGVLLWMAISLWASPGFNAGGESLWFEHLLFAVFFVVFARYSASRTAEWRSTLLGGIAAVALLHIVANPPGSSRVDNLFGNANHMAAFLLPGLGVTLAAAFGARSPKWKAIAVIAAGGLFYGVTLTLSRGAVLAAVGMVGLAALTSGRGRLVAVVGSAGILAALGIALANPTLVERFTDRGETDPYNYQRVEIWKSTVAIIGDHPLLGVGPARYEDVARRYRPAVEGEIARYMKRQAIAHNEYLHYAAESGIPAGLMILALLGGYLLMLWKTSRQSGGASGAARVHDRAALLAAGGVLAHGLVDNVFTVPVTLAVLVTVAAGIGPLSECRAVPPVRSRFGRIAAVTGLAAVCLMSTLVPALAFGLNRMGRTALGAGDVDGAVRLQRFALAVRSSEASLMLNLGTALMADFRRTGDRHTLDMAEAYFARAAEAAPDLLEPRLQSVETLVARLEGNPVTDRAIHNEITRALSEALRIDPFMPMVRKNLAESLYQTGRYPEAVLELERAVATEPNFVGGYFRLAEWYGAAGDRRRADLLAADGAAIAARFAGEANLTEYERMLLGRPLATTPTAESRP